MASLNTSANGPSIKSSYQKIVDATIPQGVSSTYSQWAVFSIQTPLTSAFQQDSAKESVLKVQSSADGDLADLLDEFSEGRVQFAFAKVRDPNSTLPKSVLIAWCGEGVPERTKGYFGNYMAVVSKLLHGYHVQITARSDNDLSPESIIQKVSDSSGSRYGGGQAVSATSKPAPPSLPNKPVALPTRSAAPAPRAPPAKDVDADGWGADAPQVSRSQLEKVESAYKPTKVNMAELTSQKPAPSFQQPASATSDPDLVRGGYQPVGKVDIAAIRRQAQQGGSAQDDRPTIVKGSYEPVGKVDIAAIKARAQPPRESPADQNEAPAKSLADRSAAFQQKSSEQSSERLTSLPKPKVANRFGSQSSFAGTKAPTPDALGGQSAVGPAPVGIASRTFADQDGKTPAQLWAEKKAQQGGQAQRTSIGEGPASPVQSHPSGGWQSGYTGKKWSAVSTTRTGTSNVSAEATGHSDDANSEQPQPNVSSLKDRFAHEPVQDSPPPPVMSSKPASAPRLPPSIPAEEHIDIPPPPPQPRSPSPEPSASPVRIAMPVSRTAAPHEIESHPPPTIPVTSLATVADNHKSAQEVDDEDQQARATAQASAPPAPAPSGDQGGKRAIVQFDYEKAEDNEIELKEGEYVTEIEMVDADWWLGHNSAGERGLFPSNYVELVENDAAAAPATAPSAGQPAAPSLPSQPAATGGATATAQFDYEAAEDNELSFPDGAKITNVEFPDDDWWLGEYGGRKGLFPANYVALDQ